MKAISLVVAIGLLASLVSLARAAPANLSQSDRDFIQTAAQDGAAEVMEGQLALKRARRDDVKDFARHMITDYGKANAELARIAQQAGVKLAKPMNAAVKMLDAKPPAKFDLAYIGDQRAAHRNAIELFTKESTGGSYPPVKQFAAKYLPVLKEHYRMIKALPGNAS